MELSYANDTIYKPHTWFTYGLTEGVGRSGAMPCDTNGDGMAAMNKLADYIIGFKDPKIPGVRQHVQIYPENSDYKLFFRQ